jgi:hypothetical protein
MTNIKEAIAEALLNGLDEADVRQRLIADGASPKQVDYELRRLEKDVFGSALKRASLRLYKRDWVLTSFGKVAGSRPAGLSVPTIDHIDVEDFYDRFYATNFPVKLTGLVDHWPAMKSWSLDYIDRKLGSVDVQLQAGRSANDRFEIDKERHATVRPLHDVIQQMKGTGPTNDFYLTAYDGAANLEALRPLWDDLGPISLMAEPTAQEGFIWIGPEGTVTPFHHDLTNNLFVQIVGRKRIHLVPSWEIGRMRNSIHCYSTLNPSDWDTDDADLPTKLEVTLGPGEAIFLPVGWWHCVEALDPSVSMTYVNFKAPNDFYTDYRGYGGY